MKYLSSHVRYIYAHSCTLFIFAAKILSTFDDISRKFSRDDPERSYEAVLTAEQ